MKALEVCKNLNIQLVQDILTNKIKILDKECQKYDSCVICILRKYLNEVSHQFPEPNKNDFAYGFGIALIYLEYLEKKGTETP